jgi:hypothetical protein
MKTTIGSLVVVLVALSSVIAWGGEPEMSNNPTAGHQQADVQLLKTAKMRDLATSNLNAIAASRNEVANFCAKVKQGQIPIQNNNGIWMVVVNESGTIVKVANYESQKGPLVYFMKRVFSDSSHTNELHALGYEMFFDTNGTLKSCVRRDWDQVTKFSGSGRLQLFSTKTKEGQYTAEWDESGRLVSESGRKP